MGSVTRVLNKTMPHTWVMGEKKSAQFDLAGQLTGAHDHLYKPDVVQPIPTDNGAGMDTEAAALVARDRARRMARRAAGLDSTIRTSPSGAAALYSPQPKSLLGS
jgi:hypothetical protein